MKWKEYLLSIALVASAFGALAAAPAIAASREDQRLASRVEEELAADEKLKDYVLEAKVDDGVLTLTGKVALDAAKEHAEKVARLPGVRKVDNQIEVAPLTVEEREVLLQARSRAVAQVSGAGSVAPMQPLRPGEQAAATGQAPPATGEAAPATGEVPAAPGQPDEKGFVHVQLPPTPPGDPEKMVSGEVVTKSWVDTRVAADLEADPALKGSAIDVVTSDDLVVTLKGRVASEATRQRAMEIAKDVKGVTEVDDQLRVAGRRQAQPAP
jgi:osmotically-inducible protein OsmY